MRWIAGCFLNFIVVMALLNTAQARLRIDITEGAAGAMPIAVTPFTGDTAKLDDSQNMAQVIAQDLRLSARFAPISTVSAAEWKARQVENVVSGSLLRTGEDDYTVHVELLDIYGDKGVLFSDNYTHISGSQLRKLAHQISDKIYLQLTGIKGIFSTRIAYILVKPEGVSQGKPKRSYALEISDVDGFYPHTLVQSKEPMMSPAWSPDGKKLAYVSFEGKRAQIFIIHLADGRREKVCQFPGINGAPAWSPDGKQLAVVLSKAGNPAIYLIDIETKNTKRLTQGLGIDTEPVWEPGGRSLLFTSNRGGTPQIYRVSLNNGQITRLTFTGNYNARPSVTADGAYMVMAHRGVEGKFKIAKQHLKTGAFMTLTQTTGDESPSVSPNGDMVLYATHMRGQRVLSMVSMMGRGRLHLPAREGSVQEPAWSPIFKN